GQPDDAAGPPDASGTGQGVRGERVSAEGSAAHGGDAQFLLASCGFNTPHGAGEDGGRVGVFGRDRAVKENTKMALNRRRVLKGLLNGGAVTVGLPLLNCFLNGNGTALADGGKMPVRF